MADQEVPKNLCDGNPEDPELVVCGDGQGADINAPQEDNNEKQTTAEDERLGGKRALPTMFSLSIGPFISQITNALYGIVDSIWVQRAVGDKGMTAISTYNNFDIVGRAFGFWLNVGSSSVISSLYGEGKGSESPQVMVDLMRIAVIFGIFVPIALLPATKPVARWFGASEEIVDMGYDYIQPILSGSFVSIFYLLTCGTLQAEGRSLIYGIAQVSAGLLNMLALDPLFLFGFKLGNLGASIATILAEGIPCIVLLTLFFMGKFGTKPKFNMFLKKFSPYTWQTIKIGFSQFIYQVSLAIPGVVMRKYLALSCGDDIDYYNTVMASFNAMVRMFQFISCVSAATVMGFVPSAGYAFGAKRYKRVLYLMSHGVWISVCWLLFAMIFVVGVPFLVARLFSSTPAFIELTTGVFRRTFCVAFLQWVAPFMQGLMQSQQCGGRAIAITFVSQLIPIPLFSSILFWTNQSDTIRIFWTYAMNMAFSLISALPIGITKLIELIKLARADNDQKFKEEKPEDDDFQDIQVIEEL